MKHAYYGFLVILLGLASLRIIGYMQTRKPVQIGPVQTQISSTHNPIPRPNLSNIVVKDTQQPYLQAAFDSSSQEFQSGRTQPVFSTLLFFVPWDDNQTELGSTQFYSQVKPHLDFAYERQVTPIITWEPFKWVNGVRKEYSVRSLLQGESDRYIQGFSQALRAWMTAHPGFEIRIRFMHEMNAPIYDYHWAHVGSELYKQGFEYVYNRVAPVSTDLSWMVVFQNLSADLDWQNKRADDYIAYVPSVPIQYIGIDGYSRPFLKGKDGPPGGEVTPSQVLPEAFFKQIRANYPAIKLVVSETSVPYMERTDEVIPLPQGEQNYQMQDRERAAWLAELSHHLTALDQQYVLEEVTWFNGNTDYHWSLEAPEDQLTKAAFQNLVDQMQIRQIKVGLFPG